MYKVIWLLKPADGVSRERFRDWYENSHAPLAQQHFGHLMLEYRRNYIDEVVGVVPSDYVVGADPRSGEPAIRQAAAFDYAVVAEWVLPDEAAFDEIMRMFADPEIGPTFRADSAGVMHRDTVLIKVSASESTLEMGAEPELLS